MQSILFCYTHYDPKQASIAWQYRSPLPVKIYLVNNFSGVKETTFRRKRQASYFIIACFNDLGGT